MFKYTHIQSQIYYCYWPHQNITSAKNTVILRIPYSIPMVSDSAFYNLWHLNQCSLCSINAGPS